MKKIQSIYKSGRLGSAAAPASLDLPVYRLELEPPITAPSIEAAAVVTGAPPAKSRINPNEAGTVVARIGVSARSVRAISAIVACSIAQSRPVTSAAAKIFLGYRQKGLLAVGGV